MKTAFEMPQTIKISTPPDEAGTYKYSGAYKQRSGHNPWVWVYDGVDEDLAAHFTVWADGFDKGGFLTRFHLSTTYSGRQGLHIWFNVTSTGQVKFTNVDGKRLQSMAGEAEDWMKGEKLYFTELAQQFVNELVL